MPGIFISYRREDASAHASGRLHALLKQRFGSEAVFLDIEIEPGADFVDTIEKAVGSCDVLLVVVSRTWLDCVDSAGRRRLEKDGDFVRLEIETGLRGKVRVIPILIDGAQMPEAEMLPGELKPLARRRAVELRHSHWETDVEVLMAALEKTVARTRKNETTEAHAIQKPAPQTMSLTPGEARIQLRQCSLSYTPETFLECVQNGDTYGVQLFLAAGADPDTRDREGATALMLAIDKRQTDVFETLLAAGADVTAQDQHGWTPVMKAVAWGDTAMFDALRERGADVHVANNWGSTALSFGGGWNNEHMVSVLLEGASVAALNRALVSAAESRRLDMLRILVDHGADVTTAGSEALVGAINRRPSRETDISDIVIFLLDHGADVNGKDTSWGATALFLAADQGDVALVTLLLARGADVDPICPCNGYYTGGNWTPLQSAAFRGHLAIVEALLEKGADVHLKNSVGRTALHLAGRNGGSDTRLPIVRVLLARGADLNARDAEGETPLMAAVNDVPTLHYLLEQGADINAKDNRGWTALTNAARISIDGWTRALLKCGADVNTQSVDGETPLMVAIQNGQRNNIRLLLEKGASIALKDTLGRTALDRAEEISDERTRTDIVRLLKEAAAT